MTLVLAQRVRYDTRGYPAAIEGIADGRPVVILCGWVEAVDVAQAIYLERGPVLVEAPASTVLRGRLDPRRCL